MKEKLTISQMAKLRGLSTETLRHYDRVDLFKPKYVDHNTGYRYYSIFQYEILGTIKELRELGMGIQEIKAYFDQRNANKSLSILEKKHSEVVLQIKELQELENTIHERISLMKGILTSNEPLMEISIKHVTGRRLITHNRKINTNVELCYGVMELEHTINEKAPIVGTNRLGVLIDKDEMQSRNFQAASTLFVSERFRECSEKSRHVLVIPEGQYVCIRYCGELWDRSSCLEKAISYIRDNNLIIIGDTLQIAQIDVSVTDVINEWIFEIQIPVELPPIQT